MNKKILISIVLVLIIGLVGFVLMNSSSDDGNPLNTLKKTTAEKVDEMTFTGDLKDLMLKGKPLTCSYAYVSEGYTSKGYFYVDGKRVRADMTSTDPQGVEVQAHMIQDGTYMYLWDETKPDQGIKMTIPSPAETPESEPSEVPFAQNQDGPDTNYVGDYNCDSWKVDEALFTLPSGVTFSDFSEQFQNIQGKLDEAQISVPADVKAEQCEICNQLTGDSKTQCAQSLGC